MKFMIRKGEAFSDRNLFPTHAPILPSYDSEMWRGASGEVPVERGNRGSKSIMGMFKSSDLEQNLLVRLEIQQYPRDALQPERDYP
jgi:hypothetical protein